VFDLDNTIYNYEPCRLAAEKAFFQYAKSSVGIKPNLSKKAYNSARLRVHSRLNSASRHDRRLYFIEYLRILGLKSDPKFVIEANNHYWFSYFEKMKLATGVESFLIKARLRNISIALVTDLISEVQYRKLLTLNIHHLFDIVITSQETKLEKDSGQPFKLLLTNLGRKNKLSTVWFVGDSLQDFPNNFPAENVLYFISPFSSLTKHGRAIKLGSFKDLDKWLVDVINHP
jgi:putative hydrolase of the HAD superfamily